MSLIILLFLYFVPLIVAILFKQPNAASIFVLNLFLGWTFVGWVVALIWAVSKNKAA